MFIQDSFFFSISRNLNLHLSSPETVLYLHCYGDTFNLFIGTVTQSKKLKYSLEGYRTLNAFLLKVSITRQGRTADTRQHFLFSFLLKGILEYLNSSVMRFSCLPCRWPRTKQESLVLYWFLGSNSGKQNLFFQIAALLIENLL